MMIQKGKICKGFTLFEMLVVLLISSILTVLSLPTWQQTSNQMIFAKEQHKLYVFLRQIQAKVEGSSEIWLLTANRDLEGKRWCLVAQMKTDNLCDCLNPYSCTKQASLYFYYPHFGGATMLISKRYYPLEITRLNGIRDTVSSACFVLVSDKNRILFSFFNVGSLKLKNNQSESACIYDEE